MMGGRGTFASGNSVALKYKTVGELHKVKVVEGTGGLHGLPEESRSSNVYVRLNPDGSTRQLRIYNDDHTACCDIEFSPHQGQKSLHIHEYVNGERLKPRPLTAEEYEKYIKFFRRGNQ